MLKNFFTGTFGKLLQVVFVIGGFTLFFAGIFRLSIIAIVIGIVLLCMWAGIRYACRNNEPAEILQPSTIDKWRKRLLVFGSLIGLITGLGSGFLAFLSYAMSSIMTTDPPEWTPLSWFFAIMGVIIIGGVFVAQKWELVGGILLIAGAISMVLILALGLFGVYDRMNAPFVSLLALPILVPGVAFMTSWFMYRREERAKSSVSDIKSSR